MHLSLNVELKKLTNEKWEKAEFCRETGHKIASLSTVKDENNGFSFYE